MTKKEKQRSLDESFLPNSDKENKKNIYPKDHSPQKPSKDFGSLTETSKEREFPFHQDKKN